MQPAPVKTHLPSILQLVMSLVGLVSGLAGAVVLGALILFGESVTPVDASSRNQMVSLIWVCIFFGLIALPSIVLSIRRLARKPTPPSNSKNKLLLASLALSPMVGLAFLGRYLSGGLEPSLWLALVSILLVVVPIWWFVEFGRHQLAAGSLQWQWGLVNFEINVTMTIIIFFELIAIAFLMLFGGVWLAQQPEFTPFLMQMQTQMMLDPQDLTKLGEQLFPLMQKPQVVVGGFVFVALLIPLMEEAFKPLALWFFIKRNLTAVEGFTAGLLCGAAFALVESTTSILAVPGEAWWFTVIGRVGTGLLHIFTSGLMGWALTSSWRDGKYVRVGLTYSLNVVVHGLWNMFAVMGSLSKNLATYNIVIPTLPTWISSVVMVAIFSLLLVGLLVMNRRLRNEQTPPAIPSLSIQSVE
jgi:hypothetical protein